MTSSAVDELLHDDDLGARGDERVVAHRPTVDDRACREIAAPCCGQDVSDRQVLCELDRDLRGVGQVHDLDRGLEGTVCGHGCTFLVTETTASFC